MICPRTGGGNRAIVLAGGAGCRLRSITREFRGPDWPKQFQTFGNRRSLLQETLARIRSMVSPARTLVVVDARHREVAERQLADHPQVRLAIQPLDRGTAAGILLALSRIMDHDAESTVMVFPADHAIDSPRRFSKGLNSARLAVEWRPHLVVVGGVAATHPDTDFSWIVPEVAASGSGFRDVLPVRHLVEKPGVDEAGALFRQGALWSTHVIVARARALRDLLRDAAAPIARFFDDHANRSGEIRERWLADNFHRLPTIDFSSEVLARARALGVLTWPKELGWTDLGTPERLLDWFGRRKETTA